MLSPRKTGWILEACLVLVSVAVTLSATTAIPNSHPAKAQYIPLEGWSPPSVEVVHDRSANAEARALVEVTTRSMNYAPVPASVSLPLAKPYYQAPSPDMVVYTHYNNKDGSWGYVYAPLARSLSDLSLYDECVRHLAGPWYAHVTTYAASTVVCPSGYTGFGGP